MGNVGNLTWNDYNPQRIIKRKQNRIILLTFPRSDENLGLEPSVLTPAPSGDNVEYCYTNHDWNDLDVEMYMCSVYISGMKEFESWAIKHDRNKIVVGGYHPTTFPDEFRNFAFKIVRGTCDDIYETINQPGQIVDGIVNHKTIPRRDVYDIQMNQQVIPCKHPTDIVSSINTSCGCGMRPPCNFCATPIMCNKIESKPLDLIIRESCDIQKQYPKYIFIRDENFTMQKDWKFRLEVIHINNPQSKIYMFASANTLNETSIRYMADHNVYMICIGLEDPTKTYKKNDKIDIVCELLRKYHIYKYLSFIVNPLEIIGQEKAKSFYNILMSRIEQLKPEMICGNFLMPFPGTALWNEYYAFVDREDYIHYDSKTPFLIRNNVVREKMKFFLFWYQWQYYTSEFYNTHIRNFYIEDTLHLRFEELRNIFMSKYEGIWEVRP